jgi:hypothetical protein
MENDEIIFELDVDYNNYRKILMTKIIAELDDIFLLFTEENNTALISFFIINKKIIDKDKQYLINTFENLVLCLKKITNCNIDQKEYLTIILKILNITTVIEKIDECINEIMELNKNIKIEKNKFIGDLKSLFEKMKINNKLFYFMVDIIDNEKVIIKKKHENDILTTCACTDEIKKLEDDVNKNVEGMSTILAKDYFIYYDSGEMMKIIYNETLLENNNYMPFVLIESNDLFQDVYISSHKKYHDVYTNEKNKIGKCKYVLKNNKFDELLEEMSNLQYL